VGVAVVAGLAVLWSVALIVTDLRSRRLPDVLTLPAAAVTTAAALAAGHPWAVAGGTAWFLVCVVPDLLPGPAGRRVRVGRGDAKLALSLGTVAVAAAGASAWFAAVAASGILTLGTLFLPGVRQMGTDRLPHGPGMILATVAVVGLSGTGWW
jgi:leader peptidase (prepilin peptidase)/N-methyltransferase